jgi:PAS domain S-box-containing protein
MLAGCEVTYALLLRNGLEPGCARRGFAQDLGVAKAGVAWDGAAREDALPRLGSPATPHFLSQFLCMFGGAFAGMAASVNPRFLVTAPHAQSQPSELRRLEALRKYEILDTPAEAAFDDLTRLASQTCGVPIAAIGLLDAEREWFKSSIGLDWPQIPRSVSPAAHAIERADLFVVEDAAGDPRFAASPLVTAAPHLRFYAAMPILTADGTVLGVLSVWDRVSRQLTVLQAESLRILSHQVLSQIELRHKVAELNRSIQDHQRSEDALRLAEAKYRSIFENVVEGIFQTTPDGKYISVNPMLARIYGYASPDDLMAAVRDIGHQLYVDPNRRAAFIELMQTRQIVTKFESQIYRKDGTIIWISENARAVRDPHGQLLYYEGTVEDVTDRKVTEDALRNSEMLYHSLVESLPQYIFRKDLQGRVTFANQRLCQMLRLPLSEILGKTDFDLFPPSLAEKYHEDDLRVIQSRTALETIEANETPGGGKIYVQVIKSPLYDHAGQVVGIQGIFWDVTERKRMEEDLAYERDLLQSMLDNVPDSIYYKDTQCRFIKCSKALARRFGLADPALAVGKTDADFFNPAHAEPALADELEIMRTGKPLVALTEKETWADGRETWALTTKMPLRSRAGRVIGTFGVSKDITALKKAEEELAKARDSALESARLKSEFLANVSHEIRTPMNAIIGMTDLLLSTKLSAQQRDFTGTIRDSAGNLLTLVNDLLDFSKIEAGKLTLDTVDFSLRETVESTAELLAQRAQAKGIELAYRIHPEVPHFLHGDPDRLRQVLTNLLGNAVKFTEHGEVLLDVLLERATRDGITLRFSVRDTGIGIEAKALPMLFHAFTQADGSTTRKYGGTGLGLAIVKQLVELMHGEVHVESAPGVGSMFWLRVPFQPSRATRGESAIVRPRFELAGVRVLVVDDNASCRNILQEQLVSWQMQPETAASGAEALEYLRRAAAANQPFSIALIDRHMPGMDGLALAREIRRVPNLTATRLILLTSIAQYIDTRNWSQFGIEAHLAKPVREERLLEALSQALAGPAKPPPKVPRARPVPSDSARRSQPRALRVLVAEDNAVNQKLALYQLRVLGLRADTVGSGGDVLQALQRTYYPIILMDCQMPGMDGYETTRQVRALERREVETGRRSPAYIIAMTANAMHGDREKCLNAGMNDYLSKPVDLRELESVLRRATANLRHGQNRGRSAPAAVALKPAPPPPPPSTALDMSVIEGLRALRQPGGEDPVKELVGLFLADATPRVQKMAACVAEDQIATLGQLAHGLKGSASNLGARGLANYCLQLEKAAHIGSRAEAAELVRSVELEYARVRALLTALE